MYTFRQVPVVFGKSFISKVLCVDFEDVLLSVWFPPPSPVTMETMYLSIISNICLIFEVDICDIFLKQNTGLGGGSTHL